MGPRHFAVGREIIRIGTGNALWLFGIGHLKRDAILLGISNGFFAAIKGQFDLALGVSAGCPAHQRVGLAHSITFKLKTPHIGFASARLHSTFGRPEDARESHGYPFDDWFSMALVALEKQVSGAVQQTRYQPKEIG
jgi:hypothetical protein